MTSVFSVSRNIPPASTIISHFSSEGIRLAYEMLGGAPHKRGKIVLNIAAPA
jgi:hypothetical protein